MYLPFILEATKLKEVKEKGRLKFGLNPLNLAPKTKDLAA